MMHTAKQNQNHAARFLPVLDSRKRKIRGLMETRGSILCANAMEVGTDKPNRSASRLQATTLDQARAELEKIRTAQPGGQAAVDRAAGPLSPRSRTNISRARFTARKGSSTRASERVILEYWKNHLGGVRSRQDHAMSWSRAYREKRLGAGRHGADGEQGNRRLLPSPEARQ